MSAYNTKKAMLGSFKLFSSPSTASQKPIELFVGGLPHDTNISRKCFTSEEMRAFFAQFNSLVDCRLKEDKLTSRVFLTPEKFRGFGFASFLDKKVVQHILSKKIVFKNTVVVEWLK